MSLLFLQSNPAPRPPFSDWCAQVCRAIERRIGEPAAIHVGPALRSYYDVGVSPQETAADLLED